MKSRTRNVRKEKTAQDDPLGQRVIFCTECGSTIENFCFSDRADDLKAVRKTLAQCKSHGKFSGEFCSKLFIAHPDALDQSDTGE